MNCFSGLIGIRGECGTPAAPDSGLYIQDLTGISVRDANKVIHSEHESGFDLLQQKIDFATKYTEQTIRAYVQNKFTLKSSLYSGFAGRYKDNLIVNPSDAGYLRGIQFKMNKDEYHSLFISELTIQGQNTQSENIVIWDLAENRLLDTVPISAVAGQRVSQAIHKEYTSSGKLLNIFIGTDADTYKTEMGSNCCGGSNPYVTISGKKILSASSKIEGNLEGGLGTSGLSVAYSVNCTFEPLLCKLKSSLAMPVLFRAGYEVMKEMKYSHRLNSVVTVYNEDYDELMNMYDAEFRQMMGEVLENADLSNKCWKCRKKARPETALP